MDGPLNRSIKDKEYREEMRKLISEKGFTGLANDTRWDELLNLMRSSKLGLHYRFKSINGYVSEWDSEWWYHVPIPFIGVLWLDVKTVYNVRGGQLIEDETKDFSKALESKLKEMKFSYEIGNGFIRIFGYQPFDYEKFRT